MEKDLPLDSLSNTLNDHKVCQAEQGRACDQHLQDVMPNSVAFLDSAYYAPESVLPPSFLLQYSEHEKVEREIPKTTRKRIEIDLDEKVHPQSSHIGLIASMSVGVLIAVFLFPVIRLAERGTRSFVTESYTGEICRRVDQYEQINASQNIPQIEEMVPINLALSGWKEACSDMLAPHTGFDVSAAQFGNEFSAVHFSDKSIVDFSTPLWADTEGSGEQIPLTMFGLSDHMLLVMLEQEETVRSAFGQDILFKDGRIFFRDLH